jgi:hypothetical protein
MILTRFVASYKLIMSHVRNLPVTDEGGFYVFFLFSSIFLVRTVSRRTVRLSERYNSQDKMRRVSLQLITLLLVTITCTIYVSLCAS